MLLFLTHTSPVYTKFSSLSPPLSHLPHPLPPIPSVPFFGRGAPAQSFPGLLSQLVFFLTMWFCPRCCFFETCVAQATSKSFCSQGRPWTSDLPPPSACWDYRHVPQCRVYLVLGRKSRALSMVGKQALYPLVRIPALSLIFNQIVLKVEKIKYKIRKIEESTCLFTALWSYLYIHNCPFSITPI